MLIILFFALAGVIAGWRLGSHCEYGDRFLGSFIGGIFAGLCGLLLTLPVSASLPSREVMVVSRELVSMQSSSDLQGKFFLFAGSFNGDWSYRYYRKEGDYFRPREISVSGHDILVQEVDDGKPRLEVFGREYTEDWYYWIAIGPKFEYRYIFIVPVGSVVQEFKL